MANDETTSRKLHPSLRYVRNGDRVVNAIHAIASSTVACASPWEEIEAPAETTYAEVARQSFAPLTVTASTRRAPGKLPKRPKLKDRPKADDSFVNVFIEFYPDRMEGDGADVDAQIASVSAQIETWRRAAETTPPAAAAPVPRRNFLCAAVPISKLDELLSQPAIAFIHPSEPLKVDTPVPHTATRPASRAIGTRRSHGRGEGVLIGIIDVGGFDFAHPDFLRKDDTTRFVAIWDQGGDFRAPPSRFTYGSEFTESQLNSAIADASKPALPPAVFIERQSQLQPSSHGTHVASIAAGNHGVCPDAEIAAVLIDVPSPSDPLERLRTTFSDTSRVTHAVEYLLDVAKARGRPIAINVSLGTNGGAHDGSSGVSRWLDAYLATPGVAICVAAGNAGQEGPQEEGDLGWMMGRIHTNGRITARGLSMELEWTVIGNGIEDVSDNELEIWYGAEDRFVASLQPPGSAEWIEVQPRQYLENRRLPGGTTVSIYNELYHPTNGANYIAIYLSPNRDPLHFRGIQPGVWKVRLRGEEVRNGHFDAWIERDDPLELQGERGRRFFRFPSYFSAASNVDSHSISSLACGHRVIAVGNLDDVRNRINVTSSQGPTRDGRSKPEIVAPGTDIAAANGFSDPSDLWISMTGTSMACPYVTGVVGLMLAGNPRITAAQCLGILKRTAQPLAGGSYEWSNAVGYGRIDAKAAIAEARAINTRSSVR